MFCNQCEQTQNSRGCMEIGVCGKDPDMQSLQEILLYGVKGKLRAHSHLAGHFGGPWQNQQWEFPAFSGPIVATTNCILIPPETYKDRLFTTRITAVPGGKRLGPLPPAFITPNVFRVLQEKFDLKLIEAEPPTSLYSLTTVPPAAASMPV